MLDLFESGFNRLAVFLAAIVALSIGAIAVMIPLNLLLVKTGSTGIWWLFEGVEYALYFGLFLGAPWVLQQNAHVKVDLLSAALSDGAAAKLNTFVNVLGFALCILLCFYGSRGMLLEYEDGTLPDKDVQIYNWIIFAVFSFSFLMLAIEFLLRMRSHRVLRTEQADSEPSQAGL